jgi:hypothetical protein
MCNLDGKGSSIWNVASLCLMWTIWRGRERSKDAVLRSRLLKSQNHMVQWVVSWCLLEQVAILVTHNIFFLNSSGRVVLLSLNFFLDGFKCVKSLAFTSNLNTVNIFI